MLHILIVFGVVIFFDYKFHYPLIYFAEWAWVIKWLYELFVKYRVAYLGTRENVSLGRWVRMSGESLGMLHIEFVSLMRSLSNFMVSGTK